MRNFSQLTIEDQQIVEQRFVLPTNRAKLQINNKLVPFERISGALIGCTVKNTNFHSHENKNR